jgi:ferredoxin-type protein NapH
LCPLGGVQALLTGRVATFRVVQTVAAILLFVILTVLLGNVFCSWVCPIGTVVDSFDKGIEKFFPKIEAKRAERLRRRREDKHESHGILGCPLCPMSKIMSKIIYNRNGILANGILASVLVGSFALKFNVFCLVCPIGILSKGFLHLKAVLYTAHGYITSAINFVILIEIWILPVAAVLVSIRMKRYFCRKLCPLGVFFSGVGALNPFIKPKVKHEKCVMKGCPDDCEDYHLDYCGFCRSMDARKCEKVCPVDINLVDNGSLHRCTKCMECYIACDRGAIKINFIAKPDFFRVSSFLRRLKKSVGARINKKGKVAFTEEIGDECR